MPVRGHRQCRGVARTANKQGREYACEVFSGGRLRHMVLCTVVAAVIVHSERIDTHTPATAAGVLHAARSGDAETLCGLLVGDVIAETWPPAMGGCFRCHEVEQRELRAW